MGRTPCPYGYPNNCSCKTCKGDRRGERGSRGGRRGGWTPAREEAPTVGFIRNEGDGDDHLASFKKGYGNNDEHTLIADGNYSENREGFDENHDHHGRKREGGGYFSENRGNYSGPGA
jgi:hypothetical protein